MARTGRVYQKWNSVRSAYEWKALVRPVFSDERGVSGPHQVLQQRVVPESSFQSAVREDQGRRNHQIGFGNHDSVSLLAQNPDEDTGEGRGRREEGESPMRSVVCLIIESQIRLEERNSRKKRGIVSKR